MGPGQVRQSDHNANYKMHDGSPAIRRAKKLPTLFGGSQIGHDSDYAQDELGFIRFRDRRVRVVGLVEWRQDTYGSMRQRYEFVLRKTITL